MIAVKTGTIAGNFIRAIKTGTTAENDSEELQKTGTAAGIYSKN
jgi:hypothetical protein